MFLSQICLGFQTYNIMEWNYIFIIIEHQIIIQMTKCYFRNTRDTEDSS